MNPVFKTVLASLITAAIIGNFATLYTINARLARVEQMLTPAPHVQFSNSN